MTGSGPPRHWNERDGGWQKAVDGGRVTAHTTGVVSPSAMRHFALRCIQTIARLRFGSQNWHGDCEARFPTPFAPVARQGAHSLNAPLSEDRAHHPKTPLMKNLTPTQKDIAVRAYYLYLEGGCQVGLDLDYWLQAEQDIGSRFFSPPSDDKPVKAAKKPASKNATAETPATPPAPVETPKPAARKTAAKKAPTGAAPPKKAAAKKKA